jgi:hypothetical protein
VKDFHRLRGFLSTFFIELRLLKKLEAFLKHLEAFSSNVRHFEQFIEKWWLLLSKCGAFIKTSIIFEDFFRKIGAFSRIARLFKYIFSGIDNFLMM